MITSVGVHTKYFEADGTYVVVSRTDSSNNDVTITNISIKLARAEEVEAVKCLADWIHTTALQDLNN